MNVANFVFFDENSTSSTSNVLSNPSNASTMTLEVSGSSFNLKVEGRADFQGEDNWHELGIIGLKDYSVLSSISEEGIYAIPMDGISQIRLINSGSVGSFKAFGVATAQG